MVPGSPPLFPAPSSPLSQGSLPPSPPKPKPLTAEERALWTGNIDAARRKRKTHRDRWVLNARRYAPPPEDDASEHDLPEVINTNVDFRQVELKKAQLFYQIPDVLLDADDEHAYAMQQSGAIRIHQRMLNKKLQQAKVARHLDLVLLDWLSVSGFGGVKIGCDVAMTTTQTMNPLTGKMESIQIPVHKSFFFSRVKPGSLLVPADWESTIYDDAPWLGREFDLPLAVARRQWPMLEKETEIGHTMADAQRQDDSARHVRSGAAADTASHTKLVSVVEIEYKASQYLADVVHPDVIYQIVFVDGVDQPVFHGLSPNQELDAMGDLTATSMRGFSVHLGSLRDVPDDAYPPSDSTMTRPMVDEKARWMTQTAKAREISIPPLLYEETAISPENMEKWNAGELGLKLPVQDGRLSAGQVPVIQAPPSKIPAESFQAQAMLDREISQTHAIGANQAGAVNTGRRTAKEIETVQQSTDVRLQKEQARALDWFLCGVRKFDAVLRRYGDQEVVKVTDEQRAQQYLQWDRSMVQGEFLYQIRPDSQLRMDASVERQQALNLYNLLRRDELVNAQELVRHLVEAHRLDPQVGMAQPPPPKPTPPSVMVRVDLKELHEFPVGLEILQQSGYQISPEAVQNAMMVLQNEMIIEQGKLAARPEPPGHGGPAMKTSPISKRETEMTGDLSGMGSTSQPGGLGA